MPDHDCRVAEIQIRNYLTPAQHEYVAEPWTVVLQVRDVKFGGTSLHWAAAGGDEEIARALLLHHADVNVRAAS